MFDYKVTSRLTVRDIILDDVLFLCVFTYMGILAFVLGWLFGIVLFGV